MRQRDILLLVIVALLVMSTSRQSYTDMAILTTQQDGLEVVKQTAIIADGENWLSGLQWRKQVFISGVAGTGQDYQIMFDVEFGSGTDSGNTIYMSSRCRQDFGDIRVTDNDGLTELDYWIQEYTVGDDATFWVEIADSLSSSTSIYVYCGNNSLSTTSNGTNTFDFFEDWSSEDFDADRWNNINNDGSYSFSSTEAQHGSILKLEGSDGSLSQRYKSDDGFGPNSSIVWYGKLEETVGIAQITQFGFDDEIDSGRMLYRSYQGTDSCSLTDDSANVDSGPATHFDAYYLYELCRSNGSYFVDGVLIDTLTFSDMSDDWKVDLNCRDAEYDVYSDWMFVRKCVAVEPSVSSTSVHEYVDTISLSAVSYYWTQYTANVVWLILDTSTYYWTTNTSNVDDGLIIQSSINETDNDWAVISGGTIGNLAIGPFDASWFWVNVSIYASFDASTIIWTSVLQVEVEHSVHLAYLDIDEYSEYIWLSGATEWENGTFSLWDNTTLLTYIEDDPFTYRLDKSETPYLHNLTLLFNCSDTGGHQSEQSLDFSVSDYWLWINYYYYAGSSDETGLYYMMAISVEREYYTPNLPYSHFESMPELDGDLCIVFWGAITDWAYGQTGYVYYDDTTNSGHLSGIYGYYAGAEVLYVPITYNTMRYLFEDWYYATGYVVNISYYTDDSKYSEYENYNDYLRDTLDYQTLWDYFPYIDTVTDYVYGEPELTWDYPANNITVAVPIMQQLFVLTNGTWASTGLGGYKAWSIKYDVQAALYGQGYFNINCSASSHSGFYFDVYVDGQHQGVAIGRLYYDDNGQHDDEWYMRVFLTDIDDAIRFSGADVELVQRWGFSPFWKQDSVNEFTMFCYTCITVQSTDIYTVLPIIITNDFALVQDTGISYQGTINQGVSVSIYELGQLVGTASIAEEGKFSLWWDRAIGDGNITAILAFTTSTHELNITVIYEKVESVVFVVESWWLTLHLGVQNYVEFYTKTSFGNSTIYVYDNNTLQTTVEESSGGVSSHFWMNGQQGLHVITLNITHGSTTFTRSRTYYIPDWAATALVIRWSLYTFQNNYTLLNLESNWMNCTYSVYLNGSRVAYSLIDPVTLNISRTINTGEYNLTIFADGGTQNVTVNNIRYVVTPEGVTYDYSDVTITGGGHSEYTDYFITNNYDQPPGMYLSSDVILMIILGSFSIPLILYVLLTRLEVLQRLKMRSD